MLQQRKKFEGKRLNLARLFCGLTLDEVGSCIGVTKQYIQKLEKNDKCSPPTPEIVTALSRQLKVDEYFFYLPVERELTEENCYFRKQKSTSVTIKQRAIAYGAFFEEIISYLDTKLDLPKVKLPPHSDIKSLDDIEAIAARCRILWGVGPEAPIDNMTRMLENAGFVITTFNGVSDKIDAFSFWGSRPIVVQNTDKDNVCRSRFDKAHEAGHSVLHKGKSASDQGLEDEANAFASALLLPRKAFIEEFPRGTKLDWYKIIKMKKRWKASLEAIIYRAYSLDLISYAQYQSAFKQLHRFVKNMNLEWTEPNSEPPEVVYSSFDLLCNHLNCSTSDIARSINHSIDVFKCFDIPIKSKPNVVFVDFKSRQLVH